MKRKIFTVLSVLIIAGLMVAIAPAGASYHSEPGMITEEEPEHLVYIFENGVYFVPNVNADIFFHLGHWYQRSEGTWFDSPSHRGPWTVIDLSRVPKTLIEIPLEYRSSYDRYGKVPYRYVVGKVDKEYEYYGEGGYSYPYMYSRDYYYYPRAGIGIYFSGGRRHYRYRSGYYFGPGYYRYGRYDRHRYGYGTGRHRYGKHNRRGHRSRDRRRH